MEAWFRKSETKSSLKQATYAARRRLIVVENPRVCVSLELYHQLLGHGFWMFGRTLGRIGQSLSQEVGKLSL